jgi:hypothetical protein
MKHNKKRNTAFLYEALILEMTKCIIERKEARKSTVLSILKEHFHGDSILRSELDAYRSIYETRGVSKETAEKIILEAQRVYFGLNPHHVFTQQSQVINKVNKRLGKDTFNIFMPNYKSLATIAQIFSTKTSVRRKVMLENSMIVNMAGSVENKNMVPIDNLVYNVFIKKFNEKYDNLLEEQKDILFKYIFSFADEGIGLKISLNEEISRMKKLIEKNRKESPSLEGKFNSLTSLLESFRKLAIDDEIVLKVLQTQEFCREL